MGGAAAPEVLAARRPLVLVIDDLHWAQPALLDLLSRSSPSATEASSWWSAVARPELREQRPAGRAGRLKPAPCCWRRWPPRSRRRCWSTWPGRRPCPSDVAARITADRRGQPAVPRGAAAHADRGGPAAPRRRPLGGPTTWPPPTTPPTIQALLAARLDRLAGEERALLDRASVIGQAFDRAAVLALTPSRRGRRPTPTCWPWSARSCCARPGPPAAATASSSATSSSGTPPTTRCPSRPGPSCTSATPPGWPRRMRPAAARSGRCSAGTWSGPTGS